MFLDRSVYWVRGEETRSGFWPGQEGGSVSIQRLYRRASPTPQSSASCRRDTVCQIGSTCSIDELRISYLKSIRDRYVPTNSFLDYKEGCRMVAEMFGRSTVTAFLIPQFDYIVQRMIGNGWAKRTINLRIGAIKRMFEYAYKRDLITGEQFTKIKSVPRVKADNPRVKPTRIIRRSTLDRRGAVIPPCGGG